MKKFYLPLLAMLTLAGATVAHGATLHGTAGDWIVDLTLEGDPVNSAIVTVKDGTGNSVPNARVTLYFSMKPMPGMPPMNYKARAKADGDHYTAAISINMSGTWIFKVKVKASGKSEKARLSTVVK